MNYTEQYLEKCKALITGVDQQQAIIKHAAHLFAESILQGRVVHTFGSGHSRIMVEEMWPRYGSFPGFNPIVELSLTFHNLVTGANGQRQAMFIENTPGLATQILRNFNLSKLDSALIISSSGCNIVPIEMAEIFQAAGIKVVSIVSAKHAAQSKSARADGKKLLDFSDVILDSGAPAGDAMIHIEGMEMPVSPGSTVGSIILINCIKAELAAILTTKGLPPTALAASCIVGKERSIQIFNEAYDQHSTRMSRITDFNKTISIL